MTPWRLFLAWLRKPRVEVLDNRAGQHVPGVTEWGGRWIVRCNTHGPFMAVRTRRAADELREQPEVFCEACRPTYHGKRA